jgi:hypothetical protein
MIKRDDVWKALELDKDEEPRARLLELKLDSAIERHVEHIGFSLIPGIAVITINEEQLIVRFTLDEPSWSNKVVGAVMRRFRSAGWTIEHNPGVDAENKPFLTVMLPAPPPDIV